MNIEKLSPTELKQHLHKCWQASESVLPMIELEYFGGGQEFLRHGVMGLHTVFSLLSHGLLSITKVDIDPYWDEFDVIALKPNFQALCEAYVPSEDFIGFGTHCEYDEPNGECLSDNELSEDFDAKDYRGRGVFMFSEARLRSEIKTRDREWIHYRTPYRLEI